ATAAAIPLSPTRRRANPGLTPGRTKQTVIGGVHLLECRSLVASIQDFGTLETHEVFISRLRAKHGRKTGFWSQVSEATEGRGR
ncbi:DUF6880 family protein, partial [Falsiroseomonas sp.]|uniref:DUF6880 family protein n=1 Tax=Falsiroseomonas sp. TaxID=2870721 RepID=UPI003562D6AA